MRTIEIKTFPVSYLSREWVGFFNFLTGGRGNLTAMTDAFISEIVQRFGTPTYIYDLDVISQQVGALREVLPDTQMLYAVKANPNGKVLKHLASLKLGAEVISEGELLRAIKAGIATEHILLGGPRQDEALIRLALEVGVGWVSLDSMSQWLLWQQISAQRPRFFVRVNPALDPRTHEHLATGAAESKFGMTLAEAHEVAAALSAENQLAGFHIHAGSQISDAAVYDEILMVLSGFYEAFPAARYLNIGGGFGVPGFERQIFASKVRSFAAQFGLRLIIEPGRYLVAEAGLLVSRVLHVKEGALKHVIADAGMADLLRPALYDAQHPIRVLGQDVLAVVVDVDGPLCENADRLARNLRLPAVQAGDLLVVGQAGAYGFAMSSNYASSFRPAEVVVQAGQAELARRRETAEDLLRLEC